MRTLRSLAIMTATTALAVLGIGGVNDAEAHSDTGILSVEATPGPDERTVIVNVTLKYDNDGDGATGATVTAFATNANDDATAPVTLAEVTRGIYRGSLDVPFPGTWTVNARSDAPVATATVEITQPVVTTEPPTTGD